MNRPAFISILLLFFPLASESQATESNPERPNILFLLSDDQDWTESSVQMHPDIPDAKSSHIQTPNLERLAGAGMRFSRAYAPAPVCAPTRISLQTGKSPAQLNWTKASRPYTAADGFKLIPPANIRQIPNSEVTIGERLQAAGYATAHYGKWHISGGGPEQHGYDESDGDTGNGDAAPHKGDNPVDIFGMGKRAAAFMAKSQKDGTPFFVQMSYHALHYPENAKPETVDKYRKMLPNGNEKAIGRAALAENLDEGIGLLLQRIDELGLSENTYVFFMSDNGGGGARGSSNRPLSGGKGDVREGGIRVPFIARGPGIEPNSWSHQAIVGFDLYNTFSELAGIEKPAPANTEGGSFLHLLKGDERPVNRPRQELVFHFPHYQGDTPHSATMMGNYKLLHFYETGKVELYDLSEDLKESANLADRMPEKAADLRERLESYLTAIGAGIPEINPQYDPSKPPNIRQGGNRERNRDRGNRQNDRSPRNRN